jgi:hypothetical protein
MTLQRSASARLPAAEGAIVVNEAATSDLPFDVDRRRLNMTG